ncbi:MAG: aldolase [Armatimonadota bacterium]|nr:MAG: aldolase [Armatimonadota bacterium]
MWREIAKFGKKIIEAGLTGSHFGNISMRAGDRILITRSGSMLDELDENAIVTVELERPTSFDIIASTETNVHRAIYQSTSALAIIHCHSPFAVAMSMIAEEDVITPADSESVYILHEIPLITGGAGSKQLAQAASKALADHRGTIIRGHGSITAGKLMEEAYVYTCSIEHACKIKYFTDLARRGG